MYGRRHALSDSILSTLQPPTRCSIHGEPLMKQTVLFICTHNSARSQLAEGLLRHLYDDRYAAFSAGSEPAEVNPYALRVLVEAGVDTQGQHAKGIDVFADRRIDIVVTVCDNAPPAVNVNVPLAAA